VPAHSEIRDVVEKDHSRDAGVIDRSAQQRADKRVRTARFIDTCGTEVVVFGPKTLESFVEWPRSQIRPARDHDARWLAGGVRIDNSDAIRLQSPDILSQTPEAFANSSPGLLQPLVKQTTPNQRPKAFARTATFANAFSVGAGLTL
jgi:hypothetical protein